MTEAPFIPGSETSRAAARAAEARALQEGAKEKA